MSSPDSSTPCDPVTERVLGPGNHHLLRPPPETREKDYFTASALNFLKGADEPLNRFLVDARVERNPRGVPAKVIYTVPEEADDWRVLDFVPADELQAFGEAIYAFYRRALTEGSMTEVQRRFRLSFRLPDPNVERDAWWLSGGDWDARLKVLWGVEYKPDTALPLADGDDLKAICENSQGRIAKGDDDLLSKLESYRRGDSGKATVYGQLQRRLITWTGMVETVCARLRAAGDSEPLDAFIARPATGSGAKSDDIETCDGLLSLAGLKRIDQQRIPDGQYAAFRSAAAGFYARAHVGEPGLAEAEKEYRRRFRLPDPTENPEHYRIQGGAARGRLFIVVPRHHDALFGPESEGTLEELRAQDRRLESASLPLIADPALGLPEPRDTGRADDSAVEPTVAERLSKRVFPLKMIALAALAVVAALVAALLLVTDAFADKTGPTVADVRANYGDTELTVVFDEPIDPDSVGGESTAIRFFVEGERERLLAGAVPGEDGRSLTVAIDPFLTLDAEVQVEGVTDLAGNPVDSRPVPVYDRTNPRLVAVSSVDAREGEEASRLILLFFSEPLDAREALRRDLVSVASNPDGEFAVSAAVEPWDREAREVVPGPRPEFVDAVRVRMERRFEGFAGGREYFFDFSPVPGIDGNTLDHEIETPVKYTDRIPPRVTTILPTSQFAVEVAFNEPLVALPSDYLVERITIEGTELRSIEWLAEDRMLLQAGPFRRAGNPYALVIPAELLADRSPSENRIAETRREFSYNGPEDEVGPQLFNVETIDATTGEALYRFTENLAEDALDTARFAIFDNERGIEMPPTTPPVFLSTPRGDDRTQVVVRFGNSLNRDLHFVAYGIRDRAGNETEESRVAGGTYVKNDAFIDYVYIEDARTIRVEFFNTELAADSIDVSDLSIFPPREITPGIRLLEGPGGGIEAIRMVLREPLEIDPDSGEYLDYYLKIENVRDIYTGGSLPGDSGGEGDDPVGELISDINGPFLPDM